MVAPIFILRSKVTLKICVYLNSSILMLPEPKYFKSQLSPWHLASVKDGPWNLPLKFGQNWISNNWDIADIEFPVEDPQLIWWRSTAYMCEQSFSYQTQLQLSQVGLRWGWSWVGVLTIPFSWWDKKHKILPNQTIPT